MTTKSKVAIRAALLTSFAISLAAFSTRLQASQSGTCGGQTTIIPFNDVMPANVFFCSIAEAYVSGLTNGTTSSTYSPSDPVPREQMAAFVTRTLDASLKRGNRRAALNQWSLPPSFNTLGRTSLGNGPRQVVCDGADLWVTQESSNSVVRVRASDGKVLQVWTGATSAFGIVVARGRVFVTSNTSLFGSIYVIDPTSAVTTVGTLNGGLSPNPTSIAFDGKFLWVTHPPPPLLPLSEISKVDAESGTRTTFTVNPPADGIIYDGTNIWVTENSNPGTLRKLDSNGNVIATVSGLASPALPVYDGANIWVPNTTGNSVTVVRRSDATVLATLTGNGLSNPNYAAFDGERILVSNGGGGGNSVSLWNATDLRPLGSFGGGTGPARGACSDGVNFWVVFGGSPGVLARF